MKGIHVKPLKLQEIISQGETANDIFIKHEGVLVLAHLSNLNYDNNPKT